MKVDAGRVDIGLMSIADLIRTAYELKPYQVTGPDWMNSQRFDILAKMPEGATKEQVPAMLKTLLAERFKLTLHKESKEHSMYALVLGKGGLKLKESQPEAAAPPDAPPANNAPAIKMNSDGRGATVSTPGAGSVKSSIGADGMMHLELSKVSMARFAEVLSRFVDRPVVDATGLKGNYQVALDLSMTDMMRVARANGAAIPAMGPGGGPVAAAGGAAEAASDPGGGGSLFTAVQAMGLKLDSRKEAIDVYVVDHVEKTPSEN
jgi:uncharacterized protein (TIGR03435 family)